MLNSRVRVDQGGPRGAPRRGPGLHAVRAGHHRLWRLAHERVAHAGSPAVLRRHLLSAGRPVRAAGLRGRPRRDRPCVAGEPGGRGAVGGQADRAPPRLRHGGPAAGVSRARARGPRLGRTAVRIGLRRRRGGFGSAPKFPRPAELLFLLRECAAHGRAGRPRHGRRVRCRRWPTAGCGTTLAAGSTGTRSMPTGACRTSRRCSTTRRSCRSRTSRRTRRPAIRPRRRGRRNAALRVAWT